MKHKPTVLLDFDELIFRTMYIELEYIRSKFGVTLDPKEFCKNTDRFEQVKKACGLNGEIGLDWGTYHDTATREYLMSTDWQYQAPLLDPDIPDILEQVSEKYEIHIATNRDSRAAEVTWMMCKLKNIAECIQTIHYCHVFTGNKSWNTTGKAEYAKKLERKGKKVVYFFDDQKKEIVKMRTLAPKTNSYLFDEYGASRDKQKVSSWKQIKKLLTG